MNKHQPDDADHRAPSDPVDRSPRAPGSASPQPEDEHLELPHERDQSTQSTSPLPDAAMKQASKDLEAGQVDTDMRASAGLDSTQRKRYVPGAGGERPGPGPDDPSDVAGRRR